MKYEKIPITKEKRRKFDRLFKVNAIAESYKRNSILEVAEEIGILPCILTRWRQEYQKYGEGSFQGSGYARVHPKNKNVFEFEKKQKYSELRFEVLKKATPFLYQGSLLIYQFIKNNEKTYSITQMCKILDVGIGRYLRWKKNGISEKQKQIALLKHEITSIFFRFKKHYGRTKITRELNSTGFKISPKQVSFYMKQLGLRKITKRKFKKTTDSKHHYYTAPNVLNRRFTVNEPSKIWVSDITYIQTCRGFLYLTIIMDLYDRKIIGWSLGCKLLTGMTSVPAWHMAAASRQVLPGLIFHSDRGVQYANKAFRSCLDAYKCVQSMSRKGDHLDNAVSEAFFSSFKRELLDRKSKLVSQKKMKADVYNFIENWYNKERIHSSLNYKTIPQFNAACIIPPGSIKT